MGYVAKTSRKRPDGRDYWKVVYEDRRQDRPDNVPREQVIKRDHLPTLGIDEDMTFKQVKEVCRHLNSKANLEKKNERVRASSLARKNQEDLIESAFLPPMDVKEFEDKILVKRFSGSVESAAFKRLYSHWKFVQALIAEVQIEPRDYADESMVIFRYMQSNKISPGYTIKIIRILNAWGQFYTKKHGGSGIEEVKNPRGKSRQDIAKAYHTKKNYKGPADPLTPEDLTKAERHLLDYNYNWLYLSIWLGLRPEEVDNLLDKKYHKFELAEDNQTPILWVFQTKLTSVTEEKAWKPIPLFNKKQITCIKMIEEKNFKRPIYKTFRRVFTDKRVTCYSGRKGFIDLMQNLGQPLEEISVWMGHTTIEMTWKHYKQKQTVRFKKIA